MWYRIVNGFAGDRAEFSKSIRDMDTALPSFVFGGGAGEHA